MHKVSRGGATARRLDDGESPAGERGASAMPPDRSRASLALNRYFMVDAALRAIAIAPRKGLATSLPAC